jgi:hypothetical protein
MVRRRWLEGGAILCAALATMATSRPHFVKDAELPPYSTLSARIVTIEASEWPEVIVNPPDDSPERGYRATPMEPATSGTYRYLIPLEYKLARVRVDGFKECGFCGGSCKEPAGVKVAVTAVTPVTTWFLTATTGPQVELVPGGTSIDKVFTVPPGTRVWVTGDEERVNTWGVENGQARVSLVAMSTSDVEVEWGLSARLEGVCPDPHVACSPPPGTTLTLGTPTTLAPSR